MSLTTKVKISSGGAYESVFGYSRAVKADNQLHISGTCATPDFEKADAYEQTKSILDTIARVVQQADMEMEDVVRTVVYVRDINDAEKVAKAHLETFGTIRPASTIVQVDSMLRTWQRVEIETYAIR
ncbi:MULTISPECIES: Rid family hydrolase [unclassified Pantoea]|uniref:Rid family hydrolase n=1 Tax=unclassified Pantoea TaxID=2630326 RepID=UPI0028AF0F10|nr:Rid family hydrolase [Pantoea sp.]